MKFFIKYFLVTDIISKVISISEVLFWRHLPIALVVTKKVQNRYKAIFFIYPRLITEVKSMWSQAIMYNYLPTNVTVLFRYVLSICTYGRQKVNKVEIGKYLYRFFMTFFYKFLVNLLLLIKQIIILFEIYWFWNKKTNFFTEIALS